MTVDPKGGTTAQAVGETSAPGTTAAADANAATTDDDLRTEVENLRRFKEQALAEKSTLEDAKRERDELKAQLEQGGVPPTTTGPANRYQELEVEAQQYRAVLANEPRNPVAMRLLAAAEAEYRALQWNEVSAREIPRIDASAESPEVKAKAKELFLTGRFVNAQDCITSARGTVLTDAALDKRRRDEADAQAAAARAAKPSTATTSASEPVGTPGVRKMSGKEWTAFMDKHADSPSALKLSNDTDNGLVIVDWDA